MSECQSYREMIESRLAGELDDRDRKALEAHLRVCAECSEMLEVHADLEQVRAEVPEPDDTDLLVMRRGVLAQIQRRERTGATRGWGLFGGLRLHPAVGIATALALVLVGVVGGRLSLGKPELDDGLVMQEIYRQASMQEGLSDYWETPLSYTNVVVRPLGGNRLDLSFDVCRHMDVVTSTDSPLAREVLLHAILAPSTMGSKMKAMALTPEIPDPQLHDALVFTLHNDPTLAVRLEALAVLTRYPYDDQTQNALLTTLREDESVQMRLLALEYLANREVDPELLQQTIRSARLESDAAVMQRAVTLTADYQ